MTIGELAKATKVSARSIRHYEAEGILTSKRMQNGYRTFDSSAIESVRQISLLLEMGLSIRVIRELAPCFPDSTEAMGVCPKIRASLIQHRSALEKRYTELAMLMNKLDHVLALPMSQRKSLPKATRTSSNEKSASVPESH
jgi:DNA-binding transcriptional MerR regulator